MGCLLLLARHSHTQKIFQVDLLEIVAQACPTEKVFLKILQNSQESICARVSFLINLQALACNFY